uniref:C-type lectin domain-containing protein n=1 Tax=Ascaris lumbricoides TaxID=6252 RepID=A0A0M3HF16_ASCLU
MGLIVNQLKALHKTVVVATAVGRVTQLGEGKRLRFTMIALTFITLALLISGSYGKQIYSLTQIEIADDRLSALMARYLQDARRALIAVFLRYARTASCPVPCAANQVCIPPNCVTLPTAVATTTVSCLALASSASPYWIGLNKMFGQWVWSNGMIAMFSNWRPGRLMDAALPTLLVCSSTTPTTVVSGMMPDAGASGRTLKVSSARSLCNCISPN